MMDGRSTVYNNITDSDKLKQVNPENLQLEEDFLEYLESVDRSKGTIKQYKANLHIFWCWNLEFNKNKFFVDLTKRELVKFQNHALNIWQWSPRRIRVVKATISSLSSDSFGTGIAITGNPCSKSSFAETVSGLALPTLRHGMMPKNPKQLLSDI